MALETARRGTSVAHHHEIKFQIADLNPVDADEAEYVFKVNVGIITYSVSG